VAGASREAIGVEEVQQQLPLAARAFEAESPEDRNAALAEGFYRFGRRFLTTLEFAAENGPAPEWRGLLDEASALMAQWFGGMRLTDRVDEAERRARAAKDALGDLSTTTSPGVERLAASAILELPEGHPDRDVELARRALLKRLEDCRRDSDPGSLLSTIAAILNYDLEPPDAADALIGEGQAAIEHVPEDEAHAVRRFRRNAAARLIERAIAARDDGDEDAQAALAARAREFVEPLVAAGSAAADPRDLAVLGVNLEAAGDETTAAEVYRRALATPGIDAEGQRLASLRLAQVSMMHGDYDAVCSLVPPFLPWLREQYLMSVVDEDISDNGIALAKATMTLAVAQAAKDDWASAVHTLDLAKSVRLRYRGALAGTPAAPRLLELERALHAVKRGVPIEVDAPERTMDPVGTELSASARLFQAYRDALPEGQAALVDSPSVAEIASVLADDEIAVVLGVHPGGTLVAAIDSADDAAPAFAFIDHELSLGQWAGLFVRAGDEAEAESGGWLMALADGRPQDEQARELRWLLDAADAAIGTRIAELLTERGATRLIVVPHLMLHFLPFWALPSLEPFEVETAPSAAHLVEARRNPVKRLGTRAVVVSNPTGDLPVSQAEAAAVERSLGPLGITVDVLEDEDALERRVEESLSGASILHFSGHGRSDLTEPTRSALLLHPDEAAAAEASLSGAEAADWHDGKERDDDGEPTERWADVAGVGRLHEAKIGEDLVERWLESGPTSTLWGLYSGDRAMRLAELWSAGDMLVGDSLDDCRLAFLSACEAGAVGINLDIDENAGIPAAMQSFGVETLVCAIWPVSECIAALYVDLFYAELAARRGRVDVADVARIVADELRTMDAAEARTRLDALRRRCDDPLARISIEAFANDALARRGPQPFSEPLDWAAFHVLGKGELILEEAR
jgi:CHAT domain-containing protein